MTVVVVGLLALSAGKAHPASLRIGAGVVRPEALGSAPWLGIAVACRLGRMALEPEAGFWSKSETAFGLKSSVRDAHAGVNLTWTPLRRGRAQLLGAAGGSAHFVTSSAGPLVGEAASETSVRAGLQAWLALEVKLGPRGAAFVAGRSDWILRSELPDERETRVYAGIRLAF